MGDLSLGRLAGLPLTARPSVLPATLLLWLALIILALAGLHLPLGQAVLGGLAGGVLHWLAATIHPLGHAWAARRTGYPMIGIRYWWVLDTTLYPENEPALPGRIHIRRALGGPILSLAAGLAAALLAVALFPVGGLARYLSLFFALDNLLVFGLGAFLPLGFTDGSTLLRWWGKP